jgi:hypothetical protein
VLHGHGYLNPELGVGLDLGDMTRASNTPSRAAD